MRRRDRERSTGGLRAEAGFTLIEMMVVVLIIGIVIAIALATFLGARKRAEDRAIQTNMRSGLAAALAYYTEAQDWDGFDAVQSPPIRRPSRGAAPRSPTWTRSPSATAAGSRSRLGGSTVFAGRSRSKPPTC